MNKQSNRFSTGVIAGDGVIQIFEDAKRNNYALPAVNVTGSNTICAVLEAAVQVNSPVIVQFSYSGSRFLAGNGITLDPHEKSVVGAIAAAKFVHSLGESYQVPIILHTDHAARNLLPWIDGLMVENEEWYQKTGKPLFSSHMIDLSQEPLEDNIAICEKYLTRMSKLEMLLEIELGCTGGVEGEVDNTGLDNALLYTQPEDVAFAYERLGRISNRFTIAASIGNVHGVYKPGNIKLEPKILENSQRLIEKKFRTSTNPANFVFHGGSGSSAAELSEAISYGVVKMNINTDTQWAFWEGIKSYHEKFSDFLQSQIGNPEGEDSPNKKYYEPKSYLRAAEISMVCRLNQAFSELNAINRNSI